MELMTQPVTTTSSVEDFKNLGQRARGLFMSGTCVDRICSHEIHSELTCKSDFSYFVLCFHSSLCIFISFIVWNGAEVTFTL